MKNTLCQTCLKLGKKECAVHPYFPHNIFECTGFTNNKPNEKDNNMPIDHTDHGLITDVEKSINKTIKDQIDKLDKLENGSFNSKAVQNPMDKLENGGFKLDGNKKRWDLLMDLSPIAGMYNESVNVNKLSLCYSSLSVIKAWMLNLQPVTEIDILHYCYPENVLQVLEYGAKKYAPGGWLHVPNGARRYRAAVIRHFESYSLGAEKDEESGLPHLWHVECDLWIVHTLEKLNRK